MNHPHSRSLVERFNREFVTEKLREILDEVRRAIRGGQAVPRDQICEESIIRLLKGKLDTDSRPGLLRVVNATGTILHTNLGRALLSAPAIEAVLLAARHPLNLEYDVEKGKRGRRESAIEKLLMELTGAEAATVVNNNAAAVLLALNTLADRREVVVSRGELIEIGGSFRIPEIMTKSGAILREVGTTNRTHPADYERAVNDETALILKVHTSNYRVIGFSAEVDLRELVSIGQQHRLPVMEDLGSGALLDLSRYGLPREPLVQDRIAIGADVVTFSGDKILGGPQAGLIVGKKQWIDRMNENPFKRALRCDKLTLAALEATLRSYRQSADAVREIPTLKAFTRTILEMTRLGRRVVTLLRKKLGEAYEIRLEDSSCQIGSGALPTDELPTKVISIRHGKFTAERIARMFRDADPPIIGRIREDRFLLDLRMVYDIQDLVPNWSEEFVTAQPRSGDGNSEPLKGGDSKQLRKV